MQQTNNYHNIIIYYAKESRELVLGCYNHFGNLLTINLEYWTYLVVLHTMEYKINPNTEVCGISVMYFAHQCFRTPSLAKTLSM